MVIKIMKARFEVSTEGMRALQAGREPWQLAKELVSNSWDEQITRCTVELKSIGARKAKLIVEDDGKGFVDIKDAWTLMKDTPKRGNPNVRGRFNIGEKEILSVAKSAKIFTNGHVVIFPESGGRQIRKTEHRKGTRIECVLPWGTRQVENTISKLKELLVPKEIKCTINEHEVPYIKPDKIAQACLETVLQKSPLEPIKTTFRFTDIEIYRDGNNGMLYEMGIPIQKIDCPFKVNVMQKVPMPPNRDVVKDSYLKDIYATVLNCQIDNIEDVSASWIRMAIESSDVKKEIIKKVMDKRYGEKVMLWSTDTLANERALEHGFEVIHGRTLSESERKKFENIGLCHTSDKFSFQPAQADVIPFEEWTDGMKKVAAYAKYLGKKLIDREISIRMYKLKNGYASATWQDGVVSFDVANLGKAFFDEITPKTTGLILHELAHHKGNGHDSLYLDSLRELAGKAVHLAAKTSWEFTDYVY